MFTTTTWIPRLRTKRMALIKNLLGVMGRRCEIQSRPQSNYTSDRSSKGFKKTDHHGENLFRVTRGRFVVNEEHQMAMPYQPFNAIELGKIAASAIGSRACLKIEKCADGLCNKVFYLTMDDGKVVVAKIPHPNAGPPYYITKWPRSNT